MAELIAMPETTAGESTQNCSSVPVVNALDKWSAEVSTGASTKLTEIRLDQNERLLIPFTLEIGKTDVHYLDYPSLSGYFQCNGRDCVLCRIGRQKDQRDLLPLYDVVGRCIGILPVTSNMRSTAMKPQLLPALRQLNGGTRVLLAIRKLDKGRFKVTSSPLVDDIDDGAEAIEQFTEGPDADPAKWVSIYEQMPNDVLATIPEIATIMKLKGVNL